jgi:hypothetical protein
MNLDNLNLVALNAQEVETVNGGNGIHFAGTGVSTGAGSAGLKSLIHNSGDFFGGLYDHLG